MGVDKDVFSTHGITILIGVVVIFISITEGFVANSTVHDESEHKIELSLLGSRIIGFDRSPWCEGVNCRAEGMNNAGQLDADFG